MHPIANLPCGHQCFDGQQILGCPECKRIEKQQRDYRAAREAKAARKAQAGRCPKTSFWGTAKPRTSVKTTGSGVSGAFSKKTAFIGFLVGCAVAANYLATTPGQTLFMGAMGAFVVGKFHKPIIGLSCIALILFALAEGKNEKGATASPQTNASQTSSSLVRSDR